MDSDLRPTLTLTLTIVLTLGLSLRRFTDIFARWSPRIFN